MTQIHGGDEIVTKDVLSDTLKDFYGGIYPFLNGAAHAGFTPVGTIIAVMGNVAPQNYLACNGQTVNIADYKELADYFEVQFGTKNHFGGDGTTTFGVPDLRGEFLRGTGTNSHTNQGNGANVGVHQDGTEHLIIGFNKTVDKLYLNNIATSETVVMENKRDGTIANATSTDNSQAIIAATKGNAVNTNSHFTSRPTNTSVLYCIAVKNIYIGENPADNIPYDNTESGLEADNAQDAIDELDSIKASKTNLSNYILTGTKPSTALTNGTFFIDKDGALRVATDDIATTDDVGSGNSAVKSVGEVLTELNNNLINRRFTEISLNNTVNANAVLNNIPFQDYIGKNVLFKVTITAGTCSGYVMYFYFPLLGGNLVFHSEYLEYDQTPVTVRVQFINDNRFIIYSSQTAYASEFNVDYYLDNR